MLLAKWKIINSEDFEKPQSGSLRFRINTWGLLLRVLDATWVNIQTNLIRFRSLNEGLISSQKGLLFESPSFPRLRTKVGLEFLRFELKEKILTKLKIQKIVWRKLKEERVENPISAIHMNINNLCSLNNSKNQSPSYFGEESIPILRKWFERVRITNYTTKNGDEVVNQIGYWKIQKASHGCRFICIFRMLIPDDLFRLPF